MSSTYIHNTSFLFFLILLTHTFLLCSSVKGQQNYSENSITSCSNYDTAGPSPAFLYTCNGLNNSCLSFLIFKSQPPYNSTITISNLTSSNPQHLAKINNATLHTIFPKGKEVIVPVNCSCPTRDSIYYQAESKYILPQNPTYYTVAFNTFQGLSTCDSLLRANPYGATDLFPGMELYVPLRCACPTRNQITNRTNYLITYPVNSGDSISHIAQRFNVSASSLVDANGFSSQNQILYPLTTVLIPLSNEPTSSLAIVHNDIPITSPPIVTVKKKRKLLVVVAIATTGSFVLILCVVFSVVFLLRKRTSFLKHGLKGKRITISVSSKNIREEIACIDNHSRVYKIEEINQGTESFSSRNKIKGSVYRGVFGDQDILAIKKMKKDASNEVNLLGRINHFNVIKLKGYCEKDELFCLVFEYMENGSLKEWLDKSNKSIEHQSWVKRIQIALDIANGLEYIHNFTEPCYVHKGISTDNILLNRDLRAKIANFSLAEESEREISSKMDVYAFGEVLLELITGKDSIIVQDGREVMLSSVMGNIQIDDAEEKVGLFVDHRLVGNSGKVFGVQLVRLSLTCLVEEAVRRPSMGDVVTSLLKIYKDMDKCITTKE